ncbi:DUF4158 domain-containing protein [Streptomyces sp. NPDC005408]|uniref:DUF4158 domain-containing protein n=1 Tax=Streptomyces sp. NPDC005408 TaxID=3155341 RepID=UPI0033A48856
MPVEFLSDEQAEAYGTFAEEPTRPELERFFFLDDVDRDLIALRRTEHHRLCAVSRPHPVFRRGLPGGGRRPAGRGGGELGVRWRRPRPSPFQLIKPCCS